ncbi:glycosyltransferase [Ornithinimicrobium flavum]|uniref:glycosyltransferase n=1 Tax=Ornithinimicrobium flavum TaxID=1288636 RepID=UPI00106F841F|nr:hypothetical protein [Ornithinimicrobium flavum]
MAPLRGARGLSYRAYQALPAPARALPERALRAVAERELRRQPWFAGDGPHRWLLGPLNTAGQAQAWARAARQQPDVEALALSAERVATGAATLAYATDVHLSRRVQARGMPLHRDRVLGTGGGAGVTGVLSETGRAVLDDVFRRTVLDDLPALEAVGARVALVVHGSELRDLHEHAERDPASPFRGVWDERWHRLQALVDRTREVVEAFPGPVLVTTLDMLEAVPGARLLPVTVDVAAFADAPAALERPVPVVLHAPTNPRLKATEVVEPVLRRLHEQGRVVYRRLEGVPHARMPAAVAAADVVVDQLALGNVGVLAVEAMAAGRLVVGHATPAVRARARDLAGSDLPLLEADPTTFAEVMEGVLGDPETHRQLARSGTAWVRELHDGRGSVRVLREVLGG